MMRDMSPRSRSDIWAMRPLYEARRVNSRVARKNWLGLEVGVVVGVESGLAEELPQVHAVVGKTVEP